MPFLDFLKNFLSSKDQKALIENTVHTSKEDSSSNQTGTGQTGKVVNKRGRANVDNSTTTNYNFTFNITEAELNPDVKKQFFDAFQNGEIQVLRDRSAQDISGYNEFAKSASFQATINFFESRIDPGDLLALRTGLYIQYLNSHNCIDEAIRIRDTAARNSHRSRNILNLASAGYFETYIRPIFENNDPETAANEYADIVRYMPETIFINNKMIPDDIVLEIEAKIAEKAQYHLRVSKIIANGIGQQCIQTIYEAESILRRKYPNFQISINTKNVGKITYARMQIDLP